MSPNGSTAKMVELRGVQRGFPLYAVSAATGEGIPALLEATWRELERARERSAAVAVDDRTTDPVTE